MLTAKYQPVIDLAQSLGISGLNVNEGDDVLHIEGTAPNANAKQRLWDEYAKIDPDFRSGDLVLNIDNAEGDSSSTTYTIQSGDTLSKIGSNYNVSWQDIYEANRDKIDDPDKIFPGQEINIPSGE